MTPHASSAAPAAARDPPVPRRLSFRRSLRESGLPEDYLEALDAKRRQLDDSIWKYIASKEREYKNYERELKHQRRASQGQEGEATGNGVRKRRTSAENEGAGSPESSSAIVDGVDDREVKGRGSNETMDRSSIAGLKDRRASLERDKDFVGVFMPSYLPALSDRTRETPAPLDRTTSNPEQILSGSTPIDRSPTAIERTNSDSIVHVKKTTRPSQLVLQHRTSSSGSSADGRLASAMKSPTQRPKRKRVSLAVGDAIVAPSDNVPVSLTGRSTSSHSRIRQASTPAQADSASVIENKPLTMSQRSYIASAVMQAEQTAIASAKSHHESERSAWPPAVEKIDFAVAPPSANATTGSKSNIDPDGDLFDLEREDETALPPPILDSDESDEEAESEGDMPARAEAALSSSAKSNPIFTPPPGERYDSTAGVIPEPDSDPDSAVPYLPSSAQTSQMPLQPGFRRPSVVHDPVYKGSGYATAEQQAVEDETYGSSFVRPSTKGSFTSGSLGESFMEKNAELMMRLREERQQRTAQVRS